MIFRHTSKDKGLWRGWLKNGQSLELSWGNYGWDFGLGIHVHSNESDLGSRLLFLKFWKSCLVVPLGIRNKHTSIEREPQWSIYASKEFGFTLHWNHWRKSWDWPWDLHTLAYLKQMPDGSWVSVFDREKEPHKVVYPYTYVLASGEVQKRTATVSKRCHVLCRRAFKAFGWPKWVKESIDVEFDGEVGERTGSWKGGTIGCGYDLKPGETMEQCLRRMERERVFR